MTNSTEQLFQKDAFQNMDPRKIHFIKQMVMGMEGKTNEQKFQYLMKMGTEMKQAGLTFTKQELAFIIDALKSTLSPQQQKTFNLLVQMMNNMNR